MTSYVLFQLSVALYFVASALYLGFFASQTNQLRALARNVFLLAALLHTLTIAVRFIEAGHTPITSQHETVSFFAWAVAWGYLSFRWRYTVKNFGTFVSLLTMGLMLIAAFSSREIAPLPPALRSWWLPIHATIALIADGFLALACIGGVMYLLQEREIKSKHFGLFYSRLPSLEALDSLNQHCLSIGFPLLTVGLITGSVWAKQAWGTYWQWDPKEVGALITWLLYAALLHQRFTVGWRGRRAALMAIIAFLSVLFTMWGVTRLGGLHTYGT